MGHAMVERLLDAGHLVHVWNRTRAKAEPLAARGAAVREHPGDLATLDILFTTVGTGQDLEQVLFGANGVTKGGRGAPRASWSTAPASRTRASGSAPGSPGSAPP